MASGDGKTNPFGNGKSGAVGNTGGGTMAGISAHRGPDRAQKMGESIDGQFKGDMPKDGDKHLKVDPPSDRQGMIGQTAKSGMKHSPMKLSGGPSMGGENADADEGGPVGDIRNEPTADTEID